jgi:hypothetical protein
LNLAPVFLLDALVAANIALAAATVFVAIAAVWAGLVTRAGVERQIVAGIRPFVFPWLQPEWVAHVKASEPGSSTELPIKNGGSGPAFNVNGGVYWTGTAGGASAMEATALAANEESTVVVSGTHGPNFNNVRGYLRYTDAAGVEWQTHFEFAGTIGVLAEPTLRLRIVGAGRTAELGEPQYNADAWVNAPGSSELRWGAKAWRGGSSARWLRLRLEGLARRVHALEGRPRRDSRGPI